MAGRRYGEREAAEVLRRAVAKQGERLEGTPDGLSLEDLQRIGSEIGILPEDVASAASEVDQRFNWIGSNRGMTDHIERTLEGEIDADTFDACVDVLRRSCGAVGEIQRDGDRWTWTGSSTSTKTRFEVVVRGGRTRLLLHTDMSESILATMILGACAALIVGMATAKELWLYGWAWGLLAVLGAIGVVLGVTFGIRSRTQAKVSRQNGALMRELEGLSNAAAGRELAVRLETASSQEFVGEQVVTEE